MSDHPHLDTIDAITAAWKVAADDVTRALLLAAWRSAKEAAIENGYNIRFLPEVQTCSPSLAQILSDAQRMAKDLEQRGRNMVPNDDRVKP